MTLLCAVLRQAHGISHAAHLVLLAIAACIDEHGAPVYPSQATLAKDSGVTERYIEACVQECEAAGYLQVERRRVAGKRPRNFYTVRLIDQKNPESSSGKHLRGKQFTEPSSVEKKERKDLKDLQEKTVPRSPIPEAQSPNQRRGSTPAASPATVNPEGEKWLRTFAHDLKPDYVQVLQGKDPEPSTAQPSATDDPLQPPPQRRPPRKFPFDAKRFTLGDPCPDDPTHRYGDTGQSLRLLKDQMCAGCTLAAKKAASPPPP